MHVGDLGVGERPVILQHGQPGHYLVIPAGKGLEHSNGLRPIRRLSEDLAVEHHNGVGSDHHISRFPVGGFRFADADPGHLPVGRKTFVHSLIHICRADGKGYAQQLQQISAPGRLGCQNKTHQSIPLKYRPRVLAPGSKAVGFR